MATYFDSSALLALMFDEALAQSAAERWALEKDRVSSILLEAECWTVVRRAAHRLRTSAARRRHIERRLTEYLAEITLKPVDRDVIGRIATMPPLSQCRTLDAVHLATLLYFRAAADEAVVLCTFDARMIAVAEGLGISVAPRDS